MPEPGRTRGQPWEARVLGGALAVALGVGCFDLDLPTPPATPVAPSLAVLAPQPGDTLTLTGEVAVQADSVYGVYSVSVYCGSLDGGTQVYAWAAPPYTALVDFSTCQSLTEPNPDGGFPLLQLSVVAVSNADGGLNGVTNVEVVLNNESPVLAVQYPPTAQPNSPFTVVVTSNVALGSFPNVVLAGSAANSVTSVPNPDGGLPSYIAYFSSTPGLGTDTYYAQVPYVPGQAVPIEVLTDTDEVVRLTVTGTDALTFNTTEVDLSVDLSRTVWDRYIPGQPASIDPITWVAEPVAFSGGLVLPLATSSAGVVATSPWIPGVLSNTDGTFYGFDTSAQGPLPGGLDGGYLAQGLNAHGETLFFDFTGNGSNLLLAPPPPATGPLVTSSMVGPAVTPPLTNMSGAAGGDLLCLQDLATLCSDSIIEGLACFTRKLAIVSATSGITYTGPPTPGVVAGAVGQYLSPNVGVCGSSWNLVDLTSGTVSFGPTNDPNGIARGCFIQSISRLLAVGDGTFIVQLSSSCGEAAALPPEYPILRVGPGSAILGSYTAPLGTQRTVQHEVVGVLADGRIVTLSNNPPNTDFQLWSMNPSTSDVPDVTSPIAGLYDSADGTEASVVARSVYSAVDGGFAALLSGAPLGVGVVAFGPNLQPLWLYLYPRVTSTNNARLVSASSVGDVYLVDEFNNRAVSLRVEPLAPASVPAAGPPDAGPPDAGPPDAGPCILCLVVSPPVVEVVPGYSASANVGGTSPSSYSGDINLTGTGTGGMLVPPANVTISPNPLSPAYFMSGEAYYASYFNVSAAAAASLGSVPVSVTGSSPDGGLVDTVIFTINVVSSLVTVTPNPATVSIGNTLTFFVIVELGGSTDSNVTWSVDEGTAGGTIAATGVYTPPTTTGIYHVRATSVAVPSAYGEAVVTVNGG